MNLVSIKIMAQLTDLNMEEKEGKWYEEALILIMRVQE